VIIWTPARNAENTLRRAIDSVLGQTYANFEYIIIDNASTDRTGDIISEYASKDSRVRLWSNKRNIFGTELFSDVTAKIINTECDFIAELDADDEYLPDFLEKSLRFSERENLDIVVCGNAFIDAQTGSVNGVRALSRDLIVERGGFSEYFSLYHQFVRTAWAKVFRLSVLRKCDFSRTEAVTYGADTVFSMEAFRNASRVGILAEALHNYYISPKSVSYKLDAKRIASDRILHEAARGFLISKTGAVTPRNEEFLLLVYMNAIKDTLNVLLNAEIHEHEKIAGVIDIFSHEYTKQLAAPEKLGALIGDAPGLTRQRRELFAAAAEWLLTREEVPDEQIEAFCAAGEFVCAACENAGGWLFFKKLLARFLLGVGRADEARPKLDELAKLLPGDPDVAGLRKMPP
jgi:glycosyltransferase involved in cell wall biosynthesis